MAPSLEQGVAQLGVTDSVEAQQVAEVPFGDSKGKGIAIPEEPGRESDLAIDETTCAICLNQIPVSETAQPEGCDHLYCACCILHWAVYKEKPWCPQCKTPFSSLVTYRALDGQLRDIPVKESVCLLRRAHWFQDHVRAKEQAIAEASVPRPATGLSGYVEGSVIDDLDYVDYERYYEEYDDEEEVENYYYSSAAGRARIVLGNRRHGPNGYIASGRMQARPVPQPPPKGKKGKNGGGEAASSGSPHTPALTRKQSGSAIGTPGGSGSSSQPSAGRRARRNQKRAAADARAGLT